MRTKENYDGAMPSGNSVGARCFISWHRSQVRQNGREALDKQLYYLAGAMEGVSLRAQLCALNYDGGALSDKRTDMYAFL